MSTIEAWGAVGTRYHIHEETLSFFRVQAENGAVSYQNMSIEDAREASRQTSARHARAIEFKGCVKDFTVPSVNCPDGVAVTVYKPTGCPDAPPILVYLHGGGMVVGSRENYADVCKIISRDVPCIVVNADYRLSPEHPCPAQYDDADCVTRWVIMNKALVGGSNSSIVGVGGDSAGGNLAASLCHRIKVDFQILIYPMTDQTCSQPSFKEFATTPGLNQSMIDWFQDLNFTSKSQRTDPRFSPLFYDDFSSLPSALFIIAELDPLRDCGYAYMDKLKAAGVSTFCTTLSGTPHAFFHLLGTYRTKCETSLDAIVKFIRKSAGIDN